MNNKVARKFRDIQNHIRELEKNFQSYRQVTDTRIRFLGGLSVILTTTLITLTLLHFLG